MLNRYLMLFSIAATLPRDPLPVRIDAQLCHPRRLLVRASDALTLAGIEATGSRILTVLPEIGYVVVETPVGRLQASRATLRRLPGVAEVDLDRASKIAYTPNDTQWPNMWHPKAVKADLAWDTSLGANSAIVAILDTGVQVDHPDLAANVWKNPGEIANNGIDDDANGYVDDINGYDFAYNDGNPDDQNGHGTACSGLAAGVGNNSLGIIGIAPKARIMALKVAINSGYFYDSATIPAYLYGQKMGAKIYSMSYYADSVSQAEGDALRYAAGKGVLPIAAAGNESTVFPFFPGAYGEVLTVAALNTNTTKAGFSNFGSWVDVSAPGVSLWTTTPGSSYTSGFAGTSGACPVVAGLAALLWGAKPSATSAQIRKAIEDTATQQDQAPYGEFSNYGMINAQAAMAAIQSGTTTAKPVKVRWISPIGSLTDFAPAGLKAKVYGRTLSAASAYVGGSVTTKGSFGRDWFDYTLPATSGNVTIRKSGVNVSTFVPPLKSGYVYPLIEASSPGAVVTGGFAETLRPDGNTLSCTRRADGMVYLQCAFKNLPRKGAFSLVLDRAYDGTSTGTERIEVYDWATWSYPYAGFIPLRDAAIAGSPSRLSIAIPDISRYVDFEGNLYLQIRTSADLPDGANLRLDAAYLLPVKTWDRRG